MKGYLPSSLAQKRRLVNFFNNLFRRKFEEKIFSKIFKKALQNRESLLYYQSTCDAGVLRARFGTYVGPAYGKEPCGQDGCFLQFYIVRYAPVAQLDSASDSDVSDNSG